MRPRPSSWSRRIGSRRPLAIVLVVIILVSLMTIPVSASAVAEKEKDFKEKIDEIYGTFRAVVAPVAAVGVAICVLGMMLGSERDAEKYRTMIKYIVLAVIVVMLLPAMVRFGSSVMEKYKWKPPVPEVDPT